MKSYKSNKKNVLLKNISIILLGIVFIQVLIAVMGIRNSTYAANTVVKIGDFEYTIGAPVSNNELRKATAKLVNTNATEIVLPDTITYGGKKYSVVMVTGKFEKAKKLTIPCKVINDWTLYYAKNLEDLTITGTGIVHAGEFENCKKLETVRMKKVTSIGNCTFMGLEKLKSVYVGSSLKVIGQSAFKGCKNLEYFDVPSPNNIQSINAYAFYGCINLEGSAGTSLIGNNLKIVGYKAFFNCKSFSDIVWFKNVEDIGEYAFYGSGIYSVRLEGSISEIKTYAFANCASLTSVTIPRNIKSIGQYAFIDGNKKFYTTIYSSVTSIGKYAFAGKTGGVINCAANSYASAYLSKANIKYTPFIDTYTLSGVKYRLESKNGLKAIAYDDNNNSIPSAIIIGRRTYTVVDKVAPTVSYLKIDKYFNKATISWTASDRGVGLVGWKITQNSNSNYGSYNVYGSKGTKYAKSSASVTKNGTYYLHIKDVSNNVKTVRIKIDSIDEKAPTITKTSTAKEGKVTYIKFTATDDVAGINYYYLATKSNSGGRIGSTQVNLSKANTNLSAKIKVTKSGTYYVVVMDKTGKMKVSNAIKVTV